jgi:uncharacterized integral membrane protein (TIGR00698 family)
VAQFTEVLQKQKVDVDKLNSKQTWLGKNLPGLIMVFLIAYFAHVVGKQIPFIGATVVAISLGVLQRNFTTIPVTFDPGIQYSLKSILKLSIILLGTSLNLWQVLSIGGSSLIVILTVVILGILLTVYLGRMMGLTGTIPTLIGVGTAICGATAIATISPIMKAKEEETAFAITTIFIFNVIAVIAYPIIGILIGMSNEIFGMWAGTAVHDTSSVVAAGYAYSNEAGGVATVVKLTRTLFLIPLAIIIGVYLGIKSPDKENGSRVKLGKIFPWFILGFLVMSIINTLGMLNKDIVSVVTDASKFMILMAMTSVGLGANFSKMKKIGVKPIILGLCSSVIVAIISIALIYIVV